MRFARINRFPFYLLAALPIVATLGACSHSPTLPKNVPSLALASPSFSGGNIPGKYACGGQDISPELSWNSPPPGTQSFALIVTDKDVPFGSFIHWVIFDLPGDKRELPEGVATDPQLPDGSRQGHNDFDAIGYGGPCPPGTSTHRYFFDLYALDSKLNLPVGAAQKDVVAAMNGHVLAQGELIGRYHR